MNTKKITVLVAAILMLAFHAMSQSPDQLAANAANAYNKMQYAAAIKLYQKIIDDGYESYALYYNLGNAYFRNNETTQAILYYEKALKLSPNNEDIKHNIDVINNKLTDKVETVPELFYKRWWKHIINMLDIDILAMVNIILLSVSLFLISIYIVMSNLLIRKFSFWAGVALLFLFGIGTLAASERNNYLKNFHEAIVTEPTVNIKSSPDENSKDIFVLHEGTKVTLMDVVAEWQEIRISNGSIGWIQISDIKKI